MKFDPPDDHVCTPLELVAVAARAIYDGQGHAVSWSQVSKSADAKVLSSLKLQSSYMQAARRLIDLVSRFHAKVPLTGPLNTEARAAIARIQQALPEALKDRRTADFAVRKARALELPIPLSLIRAAFEAHHAAARRASTG